MAILDLLKSVIVKCVWCDLVRIAECDNIYDISSGI